MDSGLKLRAESADDIGVMSAALQDAIVRVGGITFDKDAQTLTLIASRFAHEASTGARVKTILRVHNITNVQMRGVDRSDRDAFLVLLSANFAEAQPKPLGDYNFIFAGGGEIRARAEGIEARLFDFTPARKTDKMPLHPTDD